MYSKIYIIIFNLITMSEQLIYESTMEKGVVYDGVDATSIKTAIHITHLLWESWRVVETDSTDGRRLLMCGKELSNLFLERFWLSVWDILQQKTSWTNAWANYKIEWVVYSNCFRLGDNIEKIRKDLHHTLCIDSLGQLWLMIQRVDSSNCNHVTLSAVKRVEWGISTYEDMWPSFQLDFQLIS